MDHDRPAHRSYNEKEIGGLIQRASELHERAMGATERNLSLQEIEHIASELGLPQEHLQAAALELEDSLNSDKSFSLWGGPFVVDETRVVGETMTEEQWEQIVLELRRFFGRKGQVGEVGRAREWMHAVGEGADGVNFTKTRVTVRPGDDRTSIQIRKHYGGVAILYAVPFFLGVFFTGVLLTEQPDLVNFLFAGGSVTGALAVVRAFISRAAKRNAERLARLADRLQDVLRIASTPVLANEPATELIELPEIDEAEQVTAEVRRGVRG